VPTALSETPEPSIAYRQRVDELIAALQTDQHQGLTSEDARARLQRFGRNELASEPPTPAWRRFLVQFQDVLVVLLLIATAVSAGLWVYEREAGLPYEGDRHLRGGPSERDDGSCSGIESRSGGRRTSRDVGG
jgi:hypothetical protein